MARSQPFIILGMHRSGTSVATHLLELMGAYVGAKDALLAPSPDNPKGFFERKDVLAANQAIFRHHRSNWYNVDAYDAPCELLPAALTAEMQRIVTFMAQHPHWVIKDPRLCFTLPDWLAFIDNPIIIKVSRHPSEIAHSLELRNQIPLEHGYALWQAYIERALAHLDGKKIVGCDYAQLMANPAIAAQQLYEKLSEHAPGLRKPLTEEVQQFVSPDLQRAHTHESLTPTQQALFDRWRL